MGRLLLRSAKSDQFETRVDVAFQNVQAVQLPTLLPGLVVSDADPAETERIVKETGLLPKWCSQSCRQRAWETEEFLGRNGRPTKNFPWDVIERWERLVDTCASCYGWGFYEFDDEVRVRTLLERALADPRLAVYPQLQDIQRRVEVADDRFESCWPKRASVTHRCLGGGGLSWHALVRSIEMT